MARVAKKEPSVKKVATLTERISEAHGRAVKITIDNTRGDGSFTVRIGEATSLGGHVFSFTVRQMDGCCGVGMVYNLGGNPGKNAMEVIVDIMKKVVGRDYSLACMTDIHNERLDHLKSGGWEEVDSFVNKNTDNTVYVLHLKKLGSVRAALN